MDGENLLDIINEPSIRKLLKESYFTENQMIILLDYLYKKRHKIKIKSNGDTVKIDGKELRRETYYKILKTARSKVAKTIISLVLLSSLNIISQEQVMQLIDITSQSLDYDLLDSIMKHVKFTLI